MQNPTTSDDLESIGEKKQKVRKKTKRRIKTPTLNSHSVTYATCGIIPTYTFVLSITDIEIPIVVGQPQFLQNEINFGGM
jgi:hypothetical protein